MSSRLKKLFYALTIASIVFTPSLYASQDDSFEEKQVLPSAVVIEGFEFELMDSEKNEATVVAEESEYDDSDPYASVVFDTTDMMPLSTMQDYEDLDKNAAKWIGQAAKDGVERKFGRAGKGITLVTGYIGKTVFGKETLVEGLVSLARSPFVIEGEYPKTCEELIGKKAKAAVDLIPGGSKVTKVTGLLANKAFGADTMTEVVIKSIQAKRQSKSLKAEAEDDVEESGDDNIDGEK